MTSANPTMEVPIKGYVVVACQGECWLGHVIKVNFEAHMIEVSFLHPKLSTAKSYVYPQHPDMMEVDPTDNISVVSPTTATGRTYALNTKGNIYSNQCT